MKITEIYNFSYDQFDAFSHFDKAYIGQNPLLNTFLRDWPSEESIINYASTRPYSTEMRKTLVDVWKSQYNILGIHEGSKNQFNLLEQENTFTIITAHQPVLFSGPLYTIYKIASTIHLSRKINAVQSDIKIIPVFITGGEDHDREEMNHLSLFGKTITWDTKQEGAVGRFDTKGIEKVIAEVGDIIGKNSGEIIKLLNHCFTKGRSYGEAHQLFIHKIFGKQGLLVLNMDNVQLKRAFSPIIEREITTRTSKSLVERTQEGLNQLGFKKQAHARDINLFFLSKEKRTRIEKIDEGYKIGDKIWSETELVDELSKSPDSFSPNVILRPVYQEFILPNLAYVGGGGELAYWIERKSQFEAFKIPFPLLIRRNSVGWLDGLIKQKMDKVGMEVQDLAEKKHEIIKKIVSQVTDLDEHLENHKRAILKEFETLSHKISKLDASLATYTQAEARKLERTLENIENKLIRTVKKKEEETVRHIEKTYSHLFPNGGLQERKENFLNYYSKYGDEWIEYLIGELDPLDSRFKLFIE